MKKIIMTLSMILSLFILVSCTNSSNKISFSNYGEAVDKEFFDYEIDLVINQFEFYVDDAELNYQYSKSIIEGKEKSQSRGKMVYSFDMDNNTYKISEEYDSKENSQSSNSDYKGRFGYLYQLDEYNDLVKVNLKTKYLYSASYDTSVKNIYEHDVYDILSESYSDFLSYVEYYTCEYYFNEKTNTLTAKYLRNDIFSFEKQEYIYQIKYKEDNFLVKAYYEDSSLSKNSIEQISISFEHKNVIVKKVNLNNYSNDN